MKSPYATVYLAAAVLFVMAGAGRAEAQTTVPTSQSTAAPAGPSVQPPPAASGATARVPALAAGTPGTTAPTPAPLDEATGVLVLSVDAGGPAAAAGIVRGDIILTAGGTAVNDARSLRDIVVGHLSGDTLVLTLRHGDAEKAVSVVLGSSDGRAWAGIVPLIDPRALLRAPPGSAGAPSAAASVVRVVPGGPADAAGIKAGDEILSVNGSTLGARSRLSSIVAGRKIGETVTLSVRSPGSPPRDITVTLAENPSKDGPYLGIEYTMTAGDGGWPFPWWRRSDRWPLAPTL